MVRVDASAAFGHPVAVMTTRKELNRLIQRIQGETRDAQIALSNDKFRRCVAPCPAQDDEEAFERFCGDVLVFYAARYVLHGTPIPYC